MTKNPALRRHLNSASTAILNAREAARHMTNARTADQIQVLLGEALARVEEAYKRAEDPNRCWSTYAFR